MIHFILNYWWQLLITIPLTALAGWSYRNGGSEDGIGRWVREVGTGLAILIDLTCFFGWEWLGVLIMGAVWIETSYFKAKGTSAKPFNWFLVGLSYSIVPLPYVVGAYFFGHHNYFLGFSIRAVIVTLFTTLWRTFQGDANKQEIGCGCIQIITLPLLLL